MRRSASEVISELEMRIARLEKSAGHKSTLKPLGESVSKWFKQLADDMVKSDFKWDKVTITEVTDRELQFTHDGDKFSFRLDYGNKELYLYENRTVLRRFDPTKDDGNKILSALAEELDRFEDD